MTALSYSIAHFGIQIEVTQNVAIWTWDILYDIKLLNKEGLWGHRIWRPEWSVHIYNSNFYVSNDIDNNYVKIFFF